MVGITKHTLFQEVSLQSVSNSGLEPELLFPVKYVELRGEKNSALLFVVPNHNPFLLILKRLMSNRQFGKLFSRFSGNMLHIYIHMNPIWY